MRMKAIPLCLLLGVSAPALAQISVGVGLPGVSIGINLGGYPELSPIPGYPVYYAPQTDANLFFYDGLYWLYSQDGWYSSTWYNGPWELLQVEAVPLFLWRVPVRYYRQPPRYFHGWHDDDPPRWGEHWGPEWQQRHRDWDHWDRHDAPHLAPLPLYQRDYAGARYPDGEHQRELRDRHYDYQPREEITQRVYRRPVAAVPAADNDDRVKRDDARRTPARPAQRAHEQASPQQQRRHRDVAVHGENLRNAPTLIPPAAVAPSPEVAKKVQQGAMPAGRPDRERERPTSARREPHNMATPPLLQPQRARVARQPPLRAAPVQRVETTARVPDRPSAQLQPPRVPQPPQAAQQAPDKVRRDKKAGKNDEQDNHGSR